ncbi:sarcosine oxidase subunit gamma family protein [Paraburkholderia aspalathi]|uniref:Sarcosine oxidase, gamma subunit family, heterotetrameric form n=1 Tax=Paraburkholderia aspalathi TaxID=1324617 RepID=A0A1I7BES2_9BURK|nr:sarcosine oxidase subunit gamma family protein [Paraburkholderia aspalathi]SFT85664.1 sarcosine oxidase, gamma subunit family, heterotetrameric form [Paraburkholderia aspalathi]
MHSQQFDKRNGPVLMAAGSRSIAHVSSTPRRDVTMRKLLGRDLVQFGGWEANWTEGARAVSASLGCNLPMRVNGVANGEGLLVLHTAHRRFRICAPIGDQRLAKLRAAIDSSLGVITELGHSRIFLRLKGSGVRRLMSMLMPIDFGEQAFPIHTMAQSHIHHAPVLVVTVLDEDGALAFDLHVPRTFAESIGEWIVHCGATQTDAA